MRTYKTTILTSMIFAVWMGAAHASQYDDAMSAKDRGDYSKARSLLQPLASQGDANSQFQLSLLDRNGQGGRVDARQSIKWLRLAAKQSHASAQTNRDVALRRMTPQKINQANAMAEACLQSNLQACD